MRDHHHLTPHSSLLTPHSSLLTPSSSLCTLHSALLHLFPASTFFPPSYGAHIAGLSANTVYTVTVYDPSGTIATTWSTTSSDAAVHYLDVESPTPQPTLQPTPVPTSGPPKTCWDALTSGSTGSGVHDLDPLQDGSVESVYCDMEIDGG